MNGPPKFDERAKFITVAQESHDFFHFALNFCVLARQTSLEDETIKDLFWIGANLYHATHLPKTQSVRSRFRTRPDPEPSPSPPRLTTPVPPADWKLPPAATLEPTPEDKEVELNIAPEPKHRQESDQGCEPTSSSIAVGVLVEFEGMDASPAQIPATESEQQLDLLDSFIESGVRGSASCLVVLCSASTRRPGSCTYTPPPLDSGSDHRAFRLAGLPRYVGSPWVERRQASAADLRAVRCSPALHPFGFGKLRPPSGSTSALGRSSSSSALRISTSASESRRCGFVAAAQVIGIPSPPRTSVCAGDSIFQGSVTVGHLHESIIKAPTTVDVTLGHRLGCALGHFHLATPTSSNPALVVILQSSACLRFLLLATPSSSSQAASISSFTA
ncbi:hypothetical protein DPX16_19374 [Anabarilius grahami]|uniref:Uncharacterized protein n=1 Tax=Anabarilius grahami TaxID=495550 RepID=A0A3N0YZX8_ANAGA|nr:hypothetical protein DPX16_19374 [Anabarilius grahami]